MQARLSAMIMKNDMCQRPTRGVKISKAVKKKETTSMNIKQAVLKASANVRGYL